MQNKNWCEHLDKVSKYTIVKYNAGDKKINLRVQTWLCPECGVHGAETEIVEDPCQEESAG